MKNVITILFLMLTTLSYSQKIDVDSVKIYLIELINNHRLEKGRNVLTYDSSLEVSAQKHTEYMFIENDVTHDELNKNNPFYVGYLPWDRGCETEICFKGGNQFTNNKNLAIFMFKAWCKSPAHYGNMMDKKHKSMGIGLKSTELTSQLKLFIMWSTITFS
jgi:uncharacterized protein YkwD